MTGHLALLEHHLTCRRGLDPGRQPFDQRGTHERVIGAELSVTSILTVQSPNKPSGQVGHLHRVLEAAAGG